ncbi:MAG: DUF5906 domain-containing protein, partial [Bacteroidales bacterium]|nr:DUF5906 domain-containing protein [Bacteroidales bacterium]
FTEDKNGNVDILVYTLNRRTIRIKHPKANPDKDLVYNNRDTDLMIKRLAVPREYTDPKTGESKTLKYEFPKGSGTFPFFPPMLCEKYEKGEQINTLILTEGYKKAWYASLFGVPVVGLASITCLKDKDTKAMYEDVISLIKKCKVKNVVMLYDGDCFNISLKSLENGKDLYTRPVSFYNSSCTVRELFKDFPVDVYFGCINSETVDGQPKGLDDIFIAKPGEESELVADLLQLSRPGLYFTKLNITNATNKLAKLFNFEVNSFYRTHADVIKNRPFVYRGTGYVWDDGKQELTVVVPAEAKLYFRVGDDYYKYVKIPNKYAQLEQQYHRRNITTITGDHGKKLLTHVAKYEAFCNVPDHVNYTKVINNCFNLYHQIEYTPEDGDCSTSLELVKHIFGEQYELGLDYIQLLYQQPTQILPILCLVSKENKTGKSTFIKWLKAIFGQNATVIGNDQLNNNFNGSWGSKLVIACEESFVEKISTVEKIKALSTGDKIQMEMKGRDATEIDFFGKFILASNKEENFIYANQNDIRYWVRKIPTIQTENVHMMFQLVDEIPAFLNHLNSRKMHTQHESRMWFREELLITEALKKLREASRPKIEKIIVQKIKELFLDTGENQLYLPMAYIKETILQNTKEDENYIRKILEEHLEVQRFRNGEGKYDSCTAWLPYFDIEGNYKPQSKRCRPYIFERDKFLTPEDFAKFVIDKKDEPDEIPEHDHGRRVDIFD